MEVRPQTLSLVQCRFHNQQNSSNSPNNNLPRRFSNMTYNNLENGNRAGALRCASNPPADPKSRPKRDFRFQVSCLLQYSINIDYNLYFLWYI